MILNVGQYSRIHYKVVHLQQLINNYQSMESTLVSEANTYFQGFGSIEEAHTQQKQTDSLMQFYIRVLSKYVPEGDLVEQVQLLSSSSSFSALIITKAIWSYSLILEQGSPSWNTLPSYIKEIQSQGLIDTNTLLNGLPQWIIDRAELLKKSVVEKKIKKNYTRQFYDQNKFNLLRQNNQGFARLALLLATLKADHKQELVWNKILALIGLFDLDPDRVLDLMIEAYSRSTCPGLLLVLLRKFKPESITVMLGNRIIQQCPEDLSKKIVYVGDVQQFLGKPPHSYYKQTGIGINPKYIELLAQLIKCGTVPLERILPYLHPRDISLEENEIKRMQEGKNKLFKAFTFNLQEMTEQKRKQQRDQDNTNFLGQMIFSPKLALMAELVRANDWGHFQILWSGYQEKVDLLVYQPLLAALINLIQWIIEPQFQSISLGRHFPRKKPLRDKECMGLVENYSPICQCNNLLEDRLKNLIKIMEIVGEYVGLSPRVYLKLCRVFKDILANPLKYTTINGTTQPLLEQQYEQTKRRIQAMISSCLMPGVSYQNHNPVLSNAIFEILTEFTYEFRFTCYAKIYQQTMIKNCYMAFQFQKVQSLQNVIVNNLAKNNKKAYAKKLAKLTHNHALQTFYWILKRLHLEQYEKAVPEIISALYFSCPLALQMCVFTVIYTLNSPKRPPISLKTGEQEPWFRNLTNFIGSFYRKYHYTQIKPIFAYIEAKLRKQVTLMEEQDELPLAPLSILHAILNKMFGPFILQELNKTNYDKLSAGPILFFDSIQIFSQISAAAKSRFALRNYLWQKTFDDTQTVAVKFLILLTQKRGQFIVKSRMVNDLRVFGDICDQYTVLIVQLARVLSFLARGREKYVALMNENTFDLLVNHYKIPIEIAFEIYRPSVRHISSMQPKQWEQQSEKVMAVIEKYLSAKEKQIQGKKDERKLQNYLAANQRKLLTAMSKDFFTNFWLLSLDSIAFPEKLYEQKIEALKKTIEENMPSKKNNSAQELTAAKSSLELVNREETQQRKKVKDTFNHSNRNKFLAPYLKSKDKMSCFAQIFAQFCLLPRMLLDPADALYCIKFTFQMIKANGMGSSQSIKAITLILEHVLSYLQCATKRESSLCLTVFLSEGLKIFAGWDDCQRLSQDLKIFLGIEKKSIKQNYLALRGYILKIFDRFANVIIAIKQQPYIIKNCLSLLAEIEGLPESIQQAQKLEEHICSLLSKFTTTDMQVFLKRHLTNLMQKKKYLSSNPLLAKKKQKRSSVERSSKKPIEKIGLKNEKSVSLNQSLKNSSAALETPPSNDYKWKKENKNIGKVHKNHEISFKQQNMNRDTIAAESETQIKAINHHHQICSVDSQIQDEGKPKVIWNKDRLEKKKQDNQSDRNKSSSSSRSQDFFNKKNSQKANKQSQGRKWSRDNSRDRRKSRNSKNSRDSRNSNRNWK